MSTHKFPTVLIVEDDLEIRESLSDILQDEGYMVSCAENGSVALNYLKATRNLPKLILLDISMPVMDAFQFRAEQIKDQRIANIPAALVSADGSLDQKAKAIGVVEYLKKPIELEDLLKLVHRHCHP